MDRDETFTNLDTCPECENDPISVCRLCGLEAFDQLDLAGFDREQAN